MTDYAVELYSPLGTELATLDNLIVLDYARRVNNVGQLSVTLSTKYDSLIFYGGDVIPDLKLSVKRRIGGGSFVLDMATIWLVRSAVRTIDENGQALTTLIAEDLISILNRRIVAYAAGSAQADKTAVADNFIKAIVRENLGTLATDTSRSVATYLSIAADVSAGPSISKAFSRRNVLTVMQEICKSANEAGTYLAFDIVATSPSSPPVFSTFTGQRGIDRRWPGGLAPIVLGIEFGNLSFVRREYNHIDEVTYGYAGGQGQGVDRLIGAAQDATRIAKSPFGRIESFSDARSGGTTQAQVDDEADSLIKNNIPKNIFEARIVDTPKTVYGLHYGYGDYVTAVFQGESIDARIDSVRIRFEGGKETIEANVRVDY